MSSVCLRNLFVHSSTCTGLPLILRCGSQFEASFRVRVSSIHSASLHFYFWSSKLWRSYYSSAAYFCYFYCSFFLSIIRTPPAELIIHFLVDPPPLFSVHDKFSVELQKWKLFLFYFVLHFIYWSDEINILITARFHLIQVCLYVCSKHTAYRNR
jgi:hypothetical protein